MANNHNAAIYNSLPELLEEMKCAYSQEEDKETQKRRRYWIKVWKRHVEKHGNVPLIMKCSLCSGLDFKKGVKKGIYKAVRPSKPERDEMKGKSHE